MFKVWYVQGRVRYVHCTGYGIYRVWYLQGMVFTGYGMGSKQSTTVGVD